LRDRQSLRLSLAEMSARPQAAADPINTGICSLFPRGRGCARADWDA
jgi:hypothetical protein